MRSKIAPRLPAASLALTVVSALALASLPLTAGHLSGYAAPTGLYAQAQDAGGDGNIDDVALTWSAYAGFPTGCTQGRELRIFRSDNGAAFAQIFATADNATGYSDTDLNEASRLGNDLDGRLYGIQIEAVDGGSYGFDVVVPHDQRKK